MRAPVQYYYRAIMIRTLPTLRGKSMTTYRIKRAILGVGAALALSVGSLGFAASAGATAPATKALPQAPQQNTISARKAQVASPNAARPDVVPTATISASPQILWPDQYSTITATASTDVGPTPYYLSVYDATSGTYIASCATGTTCSASVTQAYATTHVYVARLTSYLGISPVTVYYTSPSTYVEWHGVTISLKASPTTVGIGGTTTLTSTTSADIGPSPFYAEIYDQTSGTLVGLCGFTTTCSVTTSQAVATTHKFIAYVSLYSTGNPPTGIQATSNNAYVTWANTGYRVSLAGSRTGFNQETLTASTGTINVGPTPYWIQIFNLNTGARIAVCGTGTSCSATVALGYGTTNYVAFVSSYSTTLPPLGTQASSNLVAATYAIIP